MRYQTSQQTEPGKHWLYSLENTKVSRKLETHPMGAEDFCLDDGLIDRAQFHSLFIYLFLHVFAVVIHLFHQTPLHAKRAS